MQNYTKYPKINQVYLQELLISLRLWLPPSSCRQTFSLKMTIRAYDQRGSLWEHTPNMLATVDREEMEVIDGKTRGNQQHVNSVDSQPV